ncbi:UNVERIFIED_CONTAM: hypothetical protein K2H54_004826 [Gekko kuhli]
MVEEYEEIADSQYQSERQELFDEDYALVLDLEDGVAPIILKAQRLGPLASVRRDRPRDVLVQFLYQRTRDKILKEARAKNVLMYKDKKILVLLDLPPEVLEKRRRLKLVITKLNDARIRFCWTQTSDIQVYKNGLQFHAKDGVTGKALLSALGLQLSKEEKTDLLESGS